MSLATSMPPGAAGHPSPWVSGHLREPPQGRSLLLWSCKGQRDCPAEGGELSAGDSPTRGFRAHTTLSCDHKPAAGKLGGRCANCPETFSTVGTLVSTELKPARTRGCVRTALLVGPRRPALSGISDEQADLGADTWRGRSWRSAAPTPLVDWSSKPQGGPAPQR